MTHETRRSSRDPAREALVAVLPRVIAHRDDPPGLRISASVAEARERDPDLERPAVRSDPAGGIPVEVRRRVFAAGRVVLDRVVLDTAQVREELRDRPQIVSGIEEQARIVLVRPDVVAIREVGAHARWIGVFAVEGGVEVPVVVGEQECRAHAGREVVAGSPFPKGVESGGALPARVPEASVDRRGPAARRMSIAGSIPCPRIAGLAEATARNPRKEAAWAEGRGHAGVAGPFATRRGPGRRMNGKRGPRTRPGRLYALPTGGRPRRTLSTGVHWRTLASQPRHASGHIVPRRKVSDNQ